MIHKHSNSTSKKILKCQSIKEIVKENNIQLMKDDRIRTIITEGYSRQFDHRD